MTPADKIDTVAKLEALDIGTFIKDSEGYPHEIVGITGEYNGMDYDDQWRLECFGDLLEAEDALHYYGPFTL